MQSFHIDPEQVDRLLDLYKHHGAMTQDERLVLVVALVKVLLDNTQSMVRQESAKALLLHMIGIPGNDTL